MCFHNKRSCITMVDTSPPLSRRSPDDRKERQSERKKDQRRTVQDAVDQARALCTLTVFSFTQALANALPQYAANGILEFSADPWWVCMTSYFKASMWLFAAVPGVPRRFLDDEGDGSDKQRILDPNEIEEMASSAGCRQHVEVSLHFSTCPMFSVVAILAYLLATHAASTVGCFRGGLSTSRRLPSKWLLARVILALEAHLAHQCRDLGPERCL